MSGKGDGELGVHGDNCTGGYYGPDPRCEQCDRDGWWFTVVVMLVLMGCGAGTVLFEQWLEKAVNGCEAAGDVSV